MRTGYRIRRKFGEYAVLVWQGQRWQPATAATFPTREAAHHWLTRQSTDGDAKKTDEQDAPLAAACTGAADLLPVREAARVAGVSRAQIYHWIRRGKVVTQSGHHAQRVPLAAVRALALGDAARQPPPLRAPREIPGDDAAYVLPIVAARVVGVSPDSVLYWGKTGKVASRPSRHGRRVRLADVQALAAQRRAPDSPPEGAGKARE